MKKVHKTTKKQFEKPKLKRGELKEALVNRACQVAREGRLKEYTMRDFASDLGVSSGAAYRHYNSRESLFEAATEVVLKNIASAFRTRMPDDITKMKTSQIVDIICTAAVKIHAFGSRYYDLWSVYFFSAYELQKDPTANLMRFPEFEICLEELLSRGAIDHMPRSIDYLQYSLAQDAILLKWKAGKLDLHFTTFGLDDFAQGEGYTDKQLSPKSVRALVYDTTLALIESTGYDHKRWLEIDGANEFNTLRGNALTTHRG